MTQTTNYELNIVEGSDVVNPLVQTNPNFQTIDNVMKANEIRGVATATEVKSGTNHAITRNVANAVFRFTATSDFRTGDTFSVDGTTVTATLSSGEIPKDRAFIIGASVICILDGTRLTLVNCESRITGINSDEVSFDPTGATNLNSTNVENAIKEVNAKIEKGYVSVTADGNETFGETINRLYELIDFSKITLSTLFVKTESGYDFPYHLVQKGSNTLSFEKTRTAGTNTISEGIIIEETASRNYFDTITSSGASFRSGKDDVPNLGTVFTLHY